MSIKGVTSGHKPANKVNKLKLYDTVNEPRQTQSVGVMQIYIQAVEKSDRSSPPRLKSSFSGSNSIALFLPLVGL
jgi:hypothetical protein